VVTPLNILLSQNVRCINKAFFKGIFMSQETATTETFGWVICNQDLFHTVVAIEWPQYQKIHHKPGAVKGGFEKLTKILGSRIKSSVQSSMKYIALVNGKAFVVNTLRSDG